MARRRFDDVAVPAGLAGRELQRSARPASCRATCRPARRTAREDRHRVQPQVAADGGVLEPASAAGWRACGARPRRGRPCAARTVEPARPSGARTVASTPAARPSLDQDPRDGARRARSARPPRRRVARCARIPDCFAPRRHPNGQLPQSPQPAASRRVGAASQPSARAPRRRIASLGGMPGGLGDAELGFDRGDVAPTTRRRPRAPRGRGRAPIPRGRPPAPRRRSSS